MLFCQVWQLGRSAALGRGRLGGGRPGRTLLESGIHLVDLMLVLFGERLAAVTAASPREPGARRWRRVQL